MSAPSGPSIDRRLASIASRQHGLVTWQQLLDAGAHPTTVARRARAGALHRVQPGVYALGYPSRSAQSQWLGVVLSIGGDAAVSHVSAAHLHGVWKHRFPELHVSSARYHRRRAGAILHHTRTLRRRDICVIDGIPVTTLPRTLIDLGDLLTPYQLANVLHEADFRRRRYARSVRDQLERTRGRTAWAVVPRALALRDSGSAGTRSALEMRALERLSQAGIRPPAVNVQVATARRSIEVDMVWFDERCVAEIDGVGHARMRTRREDERRDRALMRAGYSVVRLEPADLGRPDTWFRRRFPT